MVNEFDEKVNQEVNRRVNVELRSIRDERAELFNVINEQNSRLIEQDVMLKRLFNDNPLTFGNLVKVHNFVDPNSFCISDKVYVCDKNSEFHLQSGQIVANEGEKAVDENGYCLVRLKDGQEHKFAIGIEGKDPAQIRLMQKQDGTFAIVSVDGKCWEVSGIPDLSLSIGDNVKIINDTKAIVGRGYDIFAGPICIVISCDENGVELLNKNEKIYVQNPKKLTLESGDRVVCDPQLFMIVNRLPRDGSQKFKLNGEMNVEWDEIGGLDSAKNELRESLELSFKNPELFKHYGLQQTRGVLLHGAPGCGKTLLARAAATCLARMHGKSSVDSGYIYVKSPEILDMWVGSTEQQIRELFERARRHYRQHGYKAILAFDEADAILPQRGTRRSSDVSDTIVPMFLGEMDGIDTKQTEENPIVVLLTNRADVIDPAIVRPGRISKHIKVERPDMQTSVKILEIHTKNIPFASSRKDAVATIAISDLFAKSRVLYVIDKQYDFTLGDCVNGAMIESIAESAKLIAMRRDMQNNQMTGVTVDDFREAINKLYDSQSGLNHSFDINEFAQSKGLRPNSFEIERRTGSR